jgi:hypothetical protein
MIAQDFLSFYISIGTYDNEYLDYIFGPGEAPVAPLREEGPFLRIQELGPFRIDDRYDMILLLEIILSLIIWQLLPMKEGKLIQQALTKN